MSQSRKGWRLAALICGVTGLAGGVGIIGLSPASAEELTVTAVTARADDGNVPANTIDNNLTTRWSASGDGQWIRFSLGAPRRVNAVALAWHLGDARRHPPVPSPTASS
ncbi:MAG TPA: discoidin domain-containing protein [Candidatus Limnocylindrales bacterium]